MLDDNWEVINGQPAHAIEQLNATNTINVIEALITLLIAKGAGNHVPLMPNENALKELHRTGTIFLLNAPGVYRDVDVTVQDANGNVFYRPPPHQDVQAHMDAFFVELESIWKNGDALDVASFILWRINWVHPFKNGNGRTARSFCYAGLCARMGVVLPGAPTVIDQIMMSRQDYESAIRVADAAAEKDKDARDLAQMRSYLDRLLQVQIASVLAAANTPTS